MRLLAIISALATAGTLVRAAPTSDAADAPHDLLDKRGRWYPLDEFSPGDPLDKRSPDGHLDKRRGAHPWNVIGYANPGCQGAVVWIEWGDLASQCKDAPRLAASMYYAVRAGTKVRTWDFPGYCSPPAANAGRGLVAEVNVVGHDGLVKSGCVEKPVMGYQISRL